MILNFGSPGKSKAKMPPLFTYTGTYRYEESVAEDGTVNWELAFLSSGTLTFQRVVDKIDVFLVGPGANGSDGSHNDSIARSFGGKGGNGGALVTCKGTSAISVQAGTQYSITIGTPGNATTGFGKSAASGGGKTGGAGAYVTDNVYAGDNAGNGSDGERAFGGSTLLWNGYKYGASGGGGGVKSAVNYYERSPGTGGTSGAGNGGAQNANGGNATANSGSGGGGGGFYSWEGSGGSGGSGIIIIRNAR